MNESFDINTDDNDAFKTIRSVLLTVACIASTKKSNHSRCIASIANHSLY